MSAHFRITTAEGGRAATVDGLAPGEYAAKREALLSPETKVGQTRYSESAVTTAELSRLLDAAFDHYEDDMDAAFWRGVKFADDRAERRQRLADHLARTTTPRKW